MIRTLFILLIWAYPCLSFRSIVLNSNLNSFCKIFAEKFDPSKQITVTLKRPLGLSLEENVENQPRGVFVSEVKEGSAKASGKIYKGLYLLAVDSTDVKNADFDAILDTITSKPETQEITMSFIDFRDVYKGPATINVKMPEGKTVTISCLKGQNLRTVLSSAGVDIYSGKAKLTNCGGGATCGTCAVGVNVPQRDWEDRPSFEALRLKKFPANCRLSCNTIIEGDCDVIINPPKIA